MKTTASEANGERHSGGPKAGGTRLRGWWDALSRGLGARDMDGGWPVILLAAVTGVLAGYAIILFSKLIAGVGFLAHATADLLGLPPGSMWLAFAFVPLGLLLSRRLLRAAGEADGEMVPDLMISAVKREGELPVRRSALKLAAAVITLGAGGSLGAEGPVAVAGGTIGSGMGQALDFGARRTRLFLGCGAAAGISAAFNAPIAGVLFAMEVVLGTFTAAALSPVIVASVFSALISRTYLGANPAFGVPTEFPLAFFRELPAYVVLGLACGALAALFVRAFYFVQDNLHRRLGKGVVTAIVAGVVVAAAGFVHPQLLGPGRPGIRMMLFGELAGGLALVVGLLKILTTSLSMGGGGAGGVFTPSLFVGASFGSFYGLMLGTLFPAAGIAPEAYALVGMAAVLAGATFAPMTAIIIVIEMTNSYQLIPALMLVCIVSYIVARRLSGESIYTLAIARKGMRIRQGVDRSILESIPVAECYDRDPDVLREDAPMREVIGRMASSRQTAFPVVDSELRLLGMITHQDLSHAVAEESLRDVLLVADLVQDDVETVAPEDSLYDALRAMRVRGMDHVPVVDSPPSGRLLGLLSTADVMGAYQTHLVLDS